MSIWQHVRPQSGCGLEEQWIYRWRGRIPAISLRRQESTGNGRGPWHAALLRRDGIGTQSLLMPHSSLEEAQAEAEVALYLMGWEASDG